MRKRCILLLVLVIFLITVSNAIAAEKAGESLGAAFDDIFNFFTIALILIGTGIGIFAGCIPGLQAEIMLALLLPFVFAIPLGQAILFLLGVYKGGKYAGSVSGTLIHAPGSPDATATLEDGWPMALKGQAGRALKADLFASVFGDMFTNLIFIFFASYLSVVALKMGPVEMTSLLVFALTFIGAVSGKSLIKGLMASLVGILLGLIGSDPVEGTVRYTFNCIHLLGGINLIAMLVGLFTISEFILLSQEEPGKTTEERVLWRKSSSKEDRSISLKHFFGYRWTLLRSSAIGAFVGILPGIGASIAAWLAYGITVRHSKHPETFGKGDVEGVIAAEAGNNAVAGSTLIPLLSLGIPGDVATAILGSAMMIHGVIPGPLIFKSQPQFIYTIYMGLIVCSFALWAEGMLFLRLAHYIVKVPKSLVFPVIVTICAFGTYVLQFNMFAVFTMVFFGVVGYIMRKYDYPLPPLLIAFILSEKLEKAYRMSLIIYDESHWTFITHPISLVLLIMSVISIIFFLPLKRKYVKVSDNLEAFN